MRIVCKPIRNAVRLRSPALLQPEPSLSAIAGLGKVQRTVSTNHTPRAHTRGSEEKRHSDALPARPLTCTPAASPGAEICSAWMLSIEAALPAAMTSSVHKTPLPVLKNPTASPFKKAQCRRTCEGRGPVTLHSSFRN